MYGGSRLRLFVFAVSALLMVAASSSAQTTYGVRAGFAADPDEFVIGGHLETPLTPASRLALRPSFEVGIGENTATLSANLDIVYWAQLPSPAWSLYFGGGPSFNGVHVDEEGNDVHGGANAIAGFQHASGVFAELRAGGGAGPAGLKAMVGYVFNYKKK